MIWNLIGCLFYFLSLERIDRWEVGGGAKGFHVVLYMYRRDQNAGMVSVQLSKRKLGRQKWQQQREAFERKSVRMRVCVYMCRTYARRCYEQNTIQTYSISKITKNVCADRCLAMWKFFAFFALLDSSPQGLGALVLHHPRRYTDVISRYFGAFSPPALFLLLSEGKCFFDVRLSLAGLDVDGYGFDVAAPSHKRIIGGTRKLVGRMRNC